MTMTKAERARMEMLEREARLARALRFPTDPVPQPMSIAEIKASLTDGGMKSGHYEKVARGWFFNSHVMQVSRGCSNGYSHSPTGNVTTSQNGGRMYRTEAEAWRAMRHEKARQVAEDLAKIDARIEKCEAEQNEILDAAGCDEPVVENCRQAN